MFGLFLCLCVIYFVYNLDFLVDYYWFVIYLSKVMGMFIEISDYFDVDDGGNNYNVYIK